jgi:GTPase
MPARIALVGRPNVGKSTLFNRLAGKRLALVSAQPGLTRDWRVAEGGLGGLKFEIVDTAGLEDVAESELGGRIRKQTGKIIAAADLVLFMIDARAGIQPHDRHFARWLRQIGKPILLVANKCEGKMDSTLLSESIELGFGEPIEISAAHNEGLAELFEALRPHLAESEAAAEQEAAAKETPEEAGVEQPEQQVPIRVAILGRPNVGKSTLVNRLLGEQRVVVGPEPGITRDAVRIAWQYRGRPIELVDTAGLRRAAKVIEPDERLAAEDTRRAIGLAHVAILVVDAELGLDKQELTIASLVLEEGRAVVIALNKWDLVEKGSAKLKAVSERLARSLPQARGAPVVTVSAKTGRNLDALVEAVIATEAVWNRRVTTSELNRWLRSIVEHNPPPVMRGRRPKIRYATQIAVRPPSFAIWTARPEAIGPSYLRYMENELRARFGLPGVPIRLVLRQGENPYARGSR